MSALEPTAVLNAPRAVTIFGREPAVILAIVEAIALVLVAFQLGVTSTSAGLISIIQVAWS